MTDGQKLDANELTLVAAMLSGFFAAKNGATIEGLLQSTGVTYEQWSSLRAWGSWPEEEVRRVEKFYSETLAQ